MRQRQSQGRTWTRCALLIAVAGWQVGCAGTEVIDKTASDVLDQAEKLQIYNHQISLTKNPIDAALAACPEKLPKPETDCVRRGLIDAGLRTAEVIALIPGCRTGRTCSYDFTTRDRLGFIPATSAVFVVNWRVTFDLRRPVVTLADLPITVANRDDFVVPQPKPPPPVPQATPLVPPVNTTAPPAKPAPVGPPS